MAAQNFVQLGLDISGFDATKEATINKFIKLFNKLREFDGKTISPVLGPGLSQFNESVAASSKLLQDMNEKLAEFKKNMSSTGTSAGNSSKGIKALTEAEAKLKVEIQEANKLILEQVKANNASVQAREKEKKALAEQASLEKKLIQQKKEAAAEQKRIDKEQKERNSQQAAQDKKDKQAQIENEKTLTRAKKESESAEKQRIKSEKEESAATQKLISDYEQLRKVQKDQATNYTNLYIANGGEKNNAQNNPAVKASFNDLQQTSTLIGEIDKNVDKATKGVGNLGNRLGSMFETVRRVAYILPGLGIAGIFNLAFEAIGKAAEATGLFASKEQTAAKNAKELNVLIKERLSLISNMYEKISELKDVDPYGLKQFTKQYEIAKSRGIAKDLSLPEDIKLSEKSLSLAEKDMKTAFGSESNINNIMGQRVKEIGEIERKLGIINAEEQRIVDIRKKVNEGKGSGLSLADIGLADGKGEKTRNAQKEQLQSELDLANEKFSLLKGFADRYFDSYNELEQKKADKFKFDSDEELTKNKERATSAIELKKKENEIILALDISSEKTKIAKIREIGRNNISLVNTDLKNVDDNTESTDIQKETARIKAANDIVAINKETQDKVERLQEYYRQRRIKAQETIDKNEIEQSAIADERIYKNEQNSLEERLAAYSSYIIKKQSLQDLEYQLAIDTLRLKSDDPTARKEIEELDSSRLTQKVNIQADVEKQVYDIIYQSTQKQLALIIKENKLEEDTHKEQYGKQLAQLNESFKSKSISYEKYRKERSKIDEKYSYESLSAVIKDDEVALKRVQYYLGKEAVMMQVSFNKMESSKGKLDRKTKYGTATLGDKKDYDTSLGEYKGYVTSVQNTELKVHEANEKLKKDRFARDSYQFKQDEKLRLQWLQAAKQITNELYNAVKEAGDREYQYRLEQVQLRKALIDEQYSYEKEAVSASSLDAKNKAALEIQIAAEKKQYSDNAAKEQKKIKHDQAIFDRDIAIANIIMSTSLAVAAAGFLTPLGIAAAVAGAIELGVVSSVRIPSYAKGVIDKSEGGLSRFGEAGPEIIEEPYKSPYLVNKETIGWLPKHTNVIPLKPNPDFGGSVPKDDSWQQTLYLAKQIKKLSNKQPVINNIEINLGFEEYKRTILGR